MDIPNDPLAPFAGLARVAQLRGHFSRSAIDRPPFRHIAYGWRSTQPDHPGIAAVKAGGRLTCVSAARTYGFWVRPASVDVLHLHLDHNRGPARHPSGAVIHRHADKFRPPAASAIWRDTVHGTIASIVRCQSLDDAVATIDSALNQGALKVQDVDAVLASLPSRFRVISELVDERAESGLESLVRLKLRRMGLSVRSQVQIRGLGRVDLLVQGSVIVELDGERFHSDRDAFARDRHRDAVAAVFGYRRLRFSGRQVLFDEALVDAALRATFSGW